MYRSLPKRTSLEQPSADDAQPELSSLQRDPHPLGYTTNLKSLSPP